MSSPTGWSGPPKHITDDSLCPFCEDEFEDEERDEDDIEETACREHSWANRTWYERYRAAMSQ